MLEIVDLKSDLRRWPDQSRRLNQVNLLIELKSQIIPVLVLVSCCISCKGLMVKDSASDTVAELYVIL